MFPPGLEKMDVENAFFLVEFHYSPCGGEGKERCKGLEGLGPERARTVPKRGVATS